jgi:hypothetical protein
MLQYFNLFSMQNIFSYRNNLIHLLFGSHETSPIILDMQARTGDTVLVMGIEMTGRSQTLPSWLGREWVKTTENKIHWPRWGKTKRKILGFGN